MKKWSKLDSAGDSHDRFSLLGSYRAGKSAHYASGAFPLLKPCAHVFVGNGFASAGARHAVSHLASEPFVVGCLPVVLAANSWSELGEIVFRPQVVIPRFS